MVVLGITVAGDYKVQPLPLQKAYPSPSPMKWQLRTYRPCMRGIEGRLAGHSLYTNTANTTTNNNETNDNNDTYHDNTNTTNNNANHDNGWPHMHAPD